MMLFGTTARFQFDINNPVKLMGNLASFLPLGGTDEPSISNANTGNFTYYNWLSSNGKENIYDITNLDCSGNFASKFNLNYVIPFTALYKIFAGCKNITKLPNGFNFNNGATDGSFAYMFFDCDGFSNISGIYLLFNSYKEQSNTFENCNNLSSVTIINTSDDFSDADGKGTQYIFKDCGNLTEIHLNTEYINDVAKFEINYNWLPNTNGKFYITQKLSSELLGNQWFTTNYETIEERN